MKKSTFFKGALAVTSIGVGILCPFVGAAALAYVGVAAATTTAGAVGLGIAGGVGGAIGGGVVGAVTALPGQIFFGKKLLKGAVKVLDKVTTDIGATPDVAGKVFPTNATLNATFASAASVLDQANAKVQAKAKVQAPKLPPV